MQKLRVGVLRGGPSSEYEVSLKTGGSVLKHLPEKYESQDIFISRDGVWHLHGLPKEPEKIIHRLDVVMNALHGEYGEDGKVQKLLDNFGVPYTGSRALGSALGMNKALSKKVFNVHGLKTPRHILLRREDIDDDKLFEIFRSFPQPCVVKPSSSGSSVGVTIVKSFKMLKDALLKALNYSKTVLVEEFIKGREATCGVIDHFRGKKIYAMFPVEIIPPDNSFFDYEAKYGGGSREICPGNFNREEKEEIQRLAILAHESLGLKHYSRSDFIVSPRGIYVLESNSLPGLTGESLFPKSLEAVGSNLPEFLEHLITLAVERK